MIFQLIRLRQIIVRICKIGFVIFVSVMQSNLVYLDIIHLGNGGDTPLISAFDLRVKGVR